MRFVLSAILIVQLSSCCVVKGTCSSDAGQAASSVLDCTKDAIAKQLPTVLAQVVEILAGNGDVGTQLLALGKQIGADVVICAVAQAETLARAKAAALSVAAPACGVDVGKDPAVVAQKAHDWLVKQGKINVKVGGCK